MQKKWFVKITSSCCFAFDSLDEAATFAKTIERAQFAEYDAYDKPYKAKDLNFSIERKELISAEDIIENAEVQP